MRGRTSRKRGEHEAKLKTAEAEDAEPAVVDADSDADCAVLAPATLTSDVSQLPLYKLGMLCIKYLGQLQVRFIRTNQFACVYHFDGLLGARRC